MQCPSFNRRERVSESYAEKNREKFKERAWTGGKGVLKDET